MGLRASLSGDVGLQRGVGWESRNHTCWDNGKNKGLASLKQAFLVEWSDCIPEWFVFRL